MEAIWMGVAPRAAATRVLAMAGPAETILKAQLRPEPTHPRAFATLLEGIALWQGAPVRAVLSVDEREASSDSTLCRAAWEDGAPLYTVAWAPGCRRRRRSGLSGVGDFRDLERLLLCEVAR